MELKNTRGFTILETLVGLVVIGFLVLVMGEIQTIFSGQNTLVSQRIDFENMKLDIRSVLYSRKQCKSAFRQGNLDLKYTGVPAQVSSVNMYRPANATNPTLVDKPVAQVGTVSSSGIRLDNIVLQPAAGSPINPPGAIQKVYRVELSINTSALKGPSKGEQRSNSLNKFKFYISTDQNDEITQCAAHGEELSPAVRGCDRTDFANYRSPNPASGLPSFMRIYDYGYLPNGAIDDGGNSSSDDDALFYCTMSGSGVYGALSVCLSKENCPWR